MAAQGLAITHTSCALSILRLIQPTRLLRSGQCPRIDQPAPTLEPEINQRKPSVPISTRQHQVGQPVSTPPAGQYGLTLIEVMVAMVILSMGALGLAALQGLGTRYSTESYFRTQAILQAYDIVERMRANASAVSAGDYTAQPAAVDHGQDCTQQRCSTRELAVHDLAQWGARNSTLLPDGAGSVSTDNAMLTVQITWRESRPGDGADEMKKLELSTRL